MAVLSFDALVPGSSVPIYDSEQVDLVILGMIISGKNSSHAGEAIRNLSEDIFDSRKIRELKLPGKGNRKTFTAHFRDAVEFCMVFPGKVAKQVRQKFADVITRHIAGDP